MNRPWTLYGRRWDWFRDPVRIPCFLERPFLSYKKVILLANALQKSDTKIIGSLDVSRSICALVRFSVPQADKEVLTSTKFSMIMTGCCRFMKPSFTGTRNNGEKCAEAASILTRALCAMVRQGQSQNESPDLRPISTYHPKSKLNYHHIPFIAEKWEVEYIFTKGE